MQYKVKVKPEDFQVREIISLPVGDKGNFGVFKLKKKGWNTVDLLRRIARRFSIPWENFSYGGKKDRHALTEQFITIKNPPKKLHIKEENFSLKLIGFSEEPMQPKHIEGNNFYIVIRSISGRYEESLVSALDTIKREGFINYFDDQRFGSYDPRQGFIAEKIIKEHFNGALKIYFTHIYPEDKKEAKERKKFISENWGKWENCLTVAKTKMEKYAFTLLSKNPRDFLSILRKIPKEEMSMYFSAYQSFLWNEVVRRLLSSILDEENILIHKGLAGDYIFFLNIANEKWRYLRDLEIPTVSSKLKMPDKNTEKILNEIMMERAIKLSMFNLRKLRQAFFKSVERKVLIIPESLSFEFADDEVYDSKRKLILQFTLPRGSYATILIKRIFAEKSKKGGKSALLCGA